MYKVYISLKFFAQRSVILILCINAEGSLFARNWSIYARSDASSNRHNHTSTFIGSHEPVG